MAHRSLAVDAMKRACKQLLEKLSLIVGPLHLDKSSCATVYLPLTADVLAQSPLLKPLPIITT